MANCIARAWGYDSHRVKETHRLGHLSAVTQAATWRIFVNARVEADGKGCVTVERDGKIIHSYVFDPEE